MTTGVTAVTSSSAKGDAMPPPSRPTRAVVAVEWALLAALVAFFVARGLLPAWKQLNSDFPNYYLAAKLLVAGAPLERMYDWIWFQRQKDHAGLDWGVVSYGPLTPFSAMVLAPLTSLSALVAKRCWLIINLALLASSIALLRSMTRLGLRRVALVTFLTVIPLRTNFDFGQQYVLLLFMLVLAAHFYLRGRPALSGGVVALATVLKLFPAIFLLFFVLKRRWSALFGFVASFTFAVGIGLLSFGAAPLKVYVTSVLPRVSGGEVHDPYYLPLNSLTVLLRRLFVFEPDLNPHPLFDATLGYVLLQPITQASLLTLSLWVIARPKDDSQDALQWGAFTALSLVLSTGASTYHFCGLVLATVLLVDALLRVGQERLALLVVLLHTLVCAPLYRLAPADPSGWQVFLGVPRLYALLAYWALFLHGIARLSTARETSRWENAAFGLFFSGAALSGVLANVRHFRGLAKTYATRVTGTRDSLLATDPAPSRRGDYFTRMDDEGYSLDDTRGESHAPAARGRDLLHPTIADDDEGWVEVCARESGIARFPLHAGPVVAADLPIQFEHAEQPSVSRDGHWLVFIRQNEGRGELWVVDLTLSDQHASQRPAPARIAGSSYDILDATVSSNGEVVFSAPRDAGQELFATHVSGGEATSLDALGRHPSLSPDGRWLAYSHEERGTWQIEAMNLASRERRRVTQGDCNSLTPAWTPDGAHLVYASDCNRGLGATALSEAPFPP